jgi:threonine-phosphate decarboxylase
MMLHGGDIYGAALKTGKKKEELLDYSANINPFGMPKEVKEALRKGILDSCHYPDPLCRELIQSISEYEKVDENYIICGNGAADLVYRLVYVKKPKRAAVLSPTFLEYEEALRQIGAEIVEYCLKEEKKVEEDILGILTEDIDMIFLCNPNNPTGTVIERKLAEAVLEKAAESGIFVVFDECFMDFVAGKERYSLTDRLEYYKNLFILKSFTKMYGIPGIRLGYGICSEVFLVQKMLEAGQSWPVSVPAQYAGIAALGLADFPEKTRQYVQRERGYMEKSLKDMGILVYPSKVNYLLLYLPTIEDFYEQMLKKGIIVRRCGNYRGLDENYYRIAVKKHGDNVTVIESIRKILLGGGV